MLGAGVGAAYQLALFAGLVTSAAGAAIAYWNVDSDRSVRALALLLASAFVWTLSAIVALYTGGSLEELAAKMIFVGVTGLVASLLVFALEYSGREEYVTRRTVAALAVEPALFLPLAFTTEYHSLVYRVGPGGDLLLSDHGPAFVLHTVYSYALILVSVALLLGVVARKERPFQRQSLAIVCSALVPLCGSVATQLGYVPIDLTPATFAFSGAALLWAITRADLVVLTPVARDRIVDDMNAGAIVLDSNDVVVDANPRMKDILGVAPDRDVVGEPVAAFVEEYEHLQEAITSGDDEIRVDADGEVRHYSVDVSALSDHRDQQIGRLYIVHDITEQKRRQRELERKNHQLDQFASLISHDLRNPLGVANGYLELAEESGDPEHFQEVYEMHDRMQRLIDDALTLARQGEAVSETQPVDLERVAEDAWTNVETDDATLATEFEGAVVTADRDRLLQVFENLFRNAVEHGMEGERPETDGGTPLHVEVGPLGGDGPTESGFYVADDGPGIPEGKRDEVFESGYSTNEDGTGLGLSIVEQIVGAHGWTIGVVESDAGGARFEVGRVD